MTKPQVLLCTDRVGYGHIRGMIAVEDALQRIGLVTESVYASQVSSPFYQWIWKYVDQGLSIPYKLFPQHFTKLDVKSTLRGMNFITSFLQLADAGAFAKFVKAKGHTIVVASHVTPSHLLHPHHNVKVYLLGLDAYPGLFCNTNSHIISTAVDKTMQKEAYELGIKNPHVTGPIVTMPVYDARKKAQQRISALKNGAPLRVTIATGGSLTHGDEIAALTGAFVTLTHAKQVERISVVVGDSERMRENVTKEARGDKRVNIIFHTDPTTLIRTADQSIGKTDILIAKTAEMTFSVAGGKVFKTFHKNPSLGPQEIADREYVKSVTNSPRGISALDHGLPPRDEVMRILNQQKTDKLFAMMEAGLKVPADGSMNVAQMIKKELKEKR